MKTITVNGKAISVNQISQWAKFNDTALAGIAAKYSITREQIDGAIKEWTNSKPVNKSESFAKLDKAISSVNAHNAGQQFTAVLNGIEAGNIKTSAVVKNAVTTFITALRVQGNSRGMMCPLTVLPDRLNKARGLSTYWGNWVKQSGSDNGADKRYYYYSRQNPNADDEALKVMLTDRAFLDVFPQYNKPEYIAARPEISTLFILGGILTDDGK
jgi:hypothetical protein